MGAFSHCDSRLTFVKQAWKIAVPVVAVALVAAAALVVVLVMIYRRRNTQRDVPVENQNAYAPM